MNEQEKIKEIRDFSPRDIAIQVMKAVEVADISQWNGKNVFEAGDYDAIFESIVDGVSQAIKQKLEEVKETIEKSKTKLDTKLYPSDKEKYRNKVLNQVLQILDNHIKN